MLPVCMQMAQVYDSCAFDMPMQSCMHPVRNTQAFGQESSLEAAADFTNSAAPKRGIILTGFGDGNSLQPSGRMHLAGSREIRVPIVALADGIVLCCTI